MTRTGALLLSSSSSSSSSSVRAPRVLLLSALCASLSALRASFLLLLLLLLLPRFALLSLPALRAFLLSLLPPPMGGLSRLASRPPARRAAFGVSCGRPLAISTICDDGQGSSRLLRLAEFTPRSVSSISFPQIVFLREPRPQLPSPFKGVGQPNDIYQTPTSTSDERGREG